MSGDESLLDVFVNVGVRETGETVDEYIQRIRTAFASLGNVNVVDQLTNGIRDGLRRAGTQSRQEADRIVRGLREAVLRFGLDRDAINIQVRLLGDADVRRRLSDVQSQVSAQQKLFSLAEPGEAGNVDRAAAIQRINELRENELATLQQITSELIQQRGIGPVADQASEAFRESAQQAQNFTQRLREVNQAISQSGDTGLREEFSAVNIEAQRLMVILRQGLQTGDLIGTEAAIADLNQLSIRFGDFRNRAQEQIEIRTNVDDFTADFNRAFREFQRQDQFDSGRTRNRFANEEDRVEFLRLRQVIGGLRDEYAQLAATAGLTNDQLQRMQQIGATFGEAVEGIHRLRQGVQGVGGAAQIAGRGLGGLSNNAYQVGQAFEDFAVGFQLDGLRGGIRGATNNVTFLIQNLTQAGVAAGTLSARMAVVASLATAAGAVIGITVLPKLIEWIQAMDDIELRSRGVAQTLEDEFRDAKFSVSLEVDARASLRAVRDAENSLEAIEEIIRQAEDTDALKFKIGATLSRAAEGDAVRDMQKIADDLAEILQRRFEQVSEDIVFPGGEAGAPPLIIPANPEEIRHVENLQRAMESFNIASKQAFENAKNGLDIGGEVRTARDSLRTLVDGFDELKASGTLSEDGAEEFLKAIESARDIFTDLTEEAQKLKSAQEAIATAAIRELEAFTQLSAEHRFLEEVNAGRLDKEDKILFDMQQQNIELEEQAKKIRAITGGDAGVDAAIDARAATLQREQEVEITREIQELEEQIAEDKASAAKDAESAAKRRLELESRLAEQEIKGKEKVATAVFALEEEQAKQAADERQRDLQERIEALQKLDRESRNFGAGDLGTEVFDDDVKNEIERLQEELKTLRESEAEKQRQQRIIELQDRIREEREEAQKRIEDLRKDVEDARKAEIDALNENVDNIQKLIDQLRQLQAAIANVRRGRDPFDQNESENNAIEELERERRINREINRMIGVTPQFAPEDIVPQFAPEDVAPMFAPEDIEGIGRAQADANEAAMDNMDFKSSSLEGLTQQTNRLLSSLNDGVLRIDTTARLG